MGRRPETRSLRCSRTTESSSWGTCHCASLWQLEVTNVLAAVQRRGVLSPAEVEEVSGISRVSSWPKRNHQRIPGMREILRLARELRLTSYDACMLTWHSGRGCHWRRWTRGCARQRRRPGWRYRSELNGRWRSAARRGENRKQNEPQVKRGFAQRPQG